LIHFYKRKKYTKNEFAWYKKAKIIFEKIHQVSFF